MAMPMNESENGVEMALIKKYCCSYTETRGVPNTEREGVVSNAEQRGEVYREGGLSLGSCSRCSMGVYCVCTILPLFLLMVDYERPSACPTVIDP